MAVEKSKMASCVLVSAVLSLVLVTVYGHVALTFPPARRFDLDFLDNSRTKGPCGMPKGTLKTSFLAGSSFTVHWHLAYAHRGGFSLRILDELERPVLDLTPRAAGSEFVRDDTTAQEYTVRLPTDFTCANCTLQLQREAVEWGNNYRFWSCADVDILPRKDYHETCSGHGYHILGRCKCHKSFSGPRCQFSEECSEDTECGLRGKCVNISATESPSSFCYCPHGFYGKGCNKKAPWKDKNVNLELYSKKELSKQFNLYWRVLKAEAELEVVMIVNGTSYAAVGWRPSGLTKQCKNFPVLGPPMDNKASTSKPEPLPEPEPKAEPAAEPKPEPEPKAEPTAEPEPSSEPNAEPEPSSEPSAEPEPSSEPAAEPKAEPSSELKKGPVPDQMAPENDNRNKRVAMHTLDGIDFKNLGDDVTVKTSISYQISSSKGRGKRAAQEQENVATTTVVTHEHKTQEPTSEPYTESTVPPEPKPTTSRPKFIPSRPKYAPKLRNKVTVVNNTAISSTSAPKTTTVEPTAEPEKEPSPEPSPEPEPSVEPEPTTEPTKTLETTAKPKPKPKSIKPKPKTTPQPTPEPSAEPEPTAEPKPEPEPTVESVLKSVHKSENLREPKAEPEPTLEPSAKAEASAEPTAEPKPEPTSEPSAEPEPSSEPAAEPKSEPAPESKSKAFPEPKPEPKSEPSPEPEPKSEPSPEPEPKSEPLPEPEPKSEPTPEPEPKSEPSPEPEPKSEPSPEPEPKSEPSPEPEPKSEPSPKSNTVPEPEPEPNNRPKTQAPSETLLVKGLKEETDYFPAHAYVPKFDFNPMDCTDIVIGTARGNYHRVLDYYTRDRSTPRVDTFWGGHDDITAASGYEENGVTTIMFRKKLQAKEPTDHSIVDELMHVIWARGQEPGKYVHAPPSGIERGSPGVGDFYRPDELKYHGHGAQRGVAAINFFEETKTSISGGILPLENNKCGGQWKYPVNCDPSNNTCEYFVSWEYLGLKRGKDSVRFTIKTKQTKHWTGIGFSKDKKMSQTDAVLGWYDTRSNRPFMMDAWLGGYSAPALDPRQDLTAAAGSLADGVTTISFVRKRNTGDSRDLAFTDDQCLYLMFVTAGGTFDPVNKRTGKHIQTPVVTENKVCIKPCGPEPTDEELSTEPSIPGLSSYNLLIRITSLADSFKPPAPGSKEYEELSQQVENGLKGQLERMKGFYALKVNGFMQNETKSIIADLTLKSIDSNTIEGSSARSLDSSVSPGTNETEREEDMEKWHRVVRDTLAQGRVGNLNVDPEFLVFEPQSLLSTRPSEDTEEPKTFFGLAETKLYVVVGCVAALILVALLQAVCTLYRSRGGARGKEQLIPNAAWKDYSSSNTNYAFEPFENDEKYTSTASTAPVRERPGVVRPHQPPPPTPGNNHQANGNKMATNGKSVSNGKAANGKSTPRHNSAAQYYHDTRSLQRPRGQYGYVGGPDRASYSLPRGMRGDPALSPNPDFYFMPSQRKYEGEVVRVFVDYKHDCTPGEVRGEKGEGRGEKGEVRGEKDNYRRKNDDFRAQDDFRSQTDDFKYKNSDKRVSRDDYHRNDYKQDDFRGRSDDFRSGKEDLRGHDDYRRQNDDTRGYSSSREESRSARDNYRSPSRNRDD